jgi:hypothetical protein
VRLFPNPWSDDLQQSLAAFMNGGDGFAQLGSPHERLFPFIGTS